MKPIISVLAAVCMFANPLTGQHKDNPTQIPIGTPRTQTGHTPAAKKPIVKHHPGTAKHGKHAPKSR